MFKSLLSNKDNIQDIFVPKTYLQSNDEVEILWKSNHPPLKDNHEDAFIRL